jgi:glycerol-1-phosphate dehydrogenase [NAD(P)+]
MEPHILELPRRVSVGKGVLDTIDQDLRSLGIAGRPLVLVDDTTLRIAGERVISALSDWNPAKENVADSTVEEAERIRRTAEGSSCIVSVGGGKIIDVGKVASFRLGIPFISVPTAPSHDGIASERASLTDRDGKASFRARPPLAVIADIAVLMNAPQRLIASGAADALSNLTSVQDWKLGRDAKGEYYSDYAAYLAKSSAKMILRSAVMIGRREERGIRDLMEALLTSSISMSLAGSSRPASGAEHAFSHVLDSLGSKSLHGEQCGVGAIMMSFLQERKWELVRDTLREVGAPVTAAGLGVSEGMIISALVKAGTLRDRYSILDVKPLDEKKARDVARATGVIS